MVRLIVLLAMLPTGIGAGAGLAVAGVVVAWGMSRPGKRGTVSGAGTTLLAAMVMVAMLVAGMQIEGVCYRMTENHDSVDRHHQERPVDDELP